MTSLFKNFAGDESGATAIEYGFIAAGIAIAIIGVVYTIGDTLTETFTTIDTGLQAQ